MQQFGHSVSTTVSNKLIVVRSYEICITWAQNSGNVREHAVSGDVMIVVAVVVSAAVASLLYHAAPSSKHLSVLPQKHWRYAV